MAMRVLILIFWVIDGQAAMGLGLKLEGSKVFSGKVDLRIKFYGGAAEETPLPIGDVLFSQVAIEYGYLPEGFEIPSQTISEIISLGQNQIYIEVKDETNSFTYERTLLPLAAFAKRVPVGENLTFDLQGLLTTEDSLTLRSPAGKKITLQGHPDTSDDTTYTLPKAPVAGMVLSTDDSGQLTFVAQGGQPFEVSTIDQLPLNIADGTKARVIGNSCDYVYVDAVTRWEVASCEFYPNWRRTGPLEITFMDPDNLPIVQQFAETNGEIDRHFFYGVDYRSTASQGIWRKRSPAATDNLNVPQRIRGKFQNCEFTINGQVICLPYLGMLRDQADNTFEAGWMRRGNKTFFKAINVNAYRYPSTLAVDLTPYSSPAVLNYKILFTCHGAGKYHYPLVETGLMGETDFMWTVYGFRDGSNDDSIDSASLDIMQPPSGPRGYRVRITGGDCDDSYRNSLYAFEEER